VTAWRRKSTPRACIPARTRSQWGCGARGTETPRKQKWIPSRREDGGEGRGRSQWTEGRKPETHQRSSRSGHQSEVLAGHGCAPRNQKDSPGAGRRGRRMTGRRRGDEGGEGPRAMPAGVANAGTRGGMEARTRGAGEGKIAREGSGEQHGRSKTSRAPRGRIRGPDREENVGERPLWKGRAGESAGKSRQGAQAAKEHGRPAQAKDSQGRGPGDARLRSSAARGEPGAGEGRGNRGSSRCVTPQ